LKGNRALCEQAGYSICFEKLAFIGARPLTIARSGTRLHRENGPAVEYPDGFALYALNGIRMKEAYVMTASEHLDPSTVLQETNADQRRELIRKIGIERMLSVLQHKSLDKRD